MTFFPRACRMYFLSILQPLKCFVFISYNLVHSNCQTFNLRCLSLLLVHVVHSCCFSFSPSLFMFTYYFLWGKFSFESKLIQLLIFFMYYGFVLLMCTLSLYGQICVILQGIEHFTDLFFLIDSKIYCCDILIVNVLQVPSVVVLRRFCES